MKEKLILNLSDAQRVTEISHALASPIRLSILSLIEDKPLNISELAKQLGIPLSSAALAVSVLEKAGLVITTSKPGVRGAQKLCALKVDSLFVQIKSNNCSSQEDVIVEQMPIGNYFDFQVGAPGGIVTENAFISSEDSLYGFYLPEHSQAQLLWLTIGFLEYRFPNYRLRRASNPKEIEFSFELCSEAPGYCTDWKSDISVWINHQRIGTFRSEGDYGNRRGRLNPAWWDDNNTQYGMMHSVRITAEGTYLDDTLFEGFHTGCLDFSKQDFISLKLGVEPDAQYVGGLNLFGEKFGDYPQNIVMRAIL